MKCVRMLCFIRHYKDTIQEKLMIFYTVLYQIYWSTCVPKIIKIELCLTKLLQKYIGAVF